MRLFSGLCHRGLGRNHQHLIATYRRSSKSNYMYFLVFEIVLIVPMHGFVTPYLKVRHCLLSILSHQYPSQAVPYLLGVANTLEYPTFTAQKSGGVYAMASPRENRNPYVSNTIANDDCIAKYVTTILQLKRKL